MKPPITTILLLALAYTFFTKELGAMTYHVAPREGSVPSWSLDGGTITTDGTLGEISTSNFESWDLRFSSPSGQMRISGGHALLHILTFNDPFFDSPPPSAALIATGDQLIANPGQNAILSLVFASQNVFADDFTGNAVVFVPRYEGHIRFVGDDPCCAWLIDNSVDSSNPIGFLQMTSSLNRSLLVVPSGPLVIAKVVTVPEPSTLAILLLAQSCLWFRTRQRGQVRF